MWSSIAPDEAWSRFKTIVNVQRTTLADMQPLSQPTTPIEEEKIDHFQEVFLPVPSAASAQEFARRPAPSSGNGKSKTRPEVEAQPAKQQDNNAEPMGAEPAFGYIGVTHEVQDPYRRTIQSIFDSSLGIPTWKDFKKAMVELGFSASPLGGSAWEFGPGPALQTEFQDTYSKSIVLHAPHLQRRLSLTSDVGTPVASAIAMAGAVRPWSNQVHLLHVLQQLLLLLCLLGKMLMFLVLVLMMGSNKKMWKRNMVLVNRKTKTKIFESKYT